jgi:hypothetical protein
MTAPAVSINFNNIECWACGVLTIAIHLGRASFTYGGAAIDAKANAKFQQFFARLASRLNSTRWAVRTMFK